MDIKKIIKNKGLTITEVATKIGVTQQALSVQISHPEKMSVERLLLIASALNCAASELLTDAASSSAQMTCPHCGKPLHLEVKP